jgi:O-antigen/teichoic acid export membrane protein
LNATIGRNIVANGIGRLWSVLANIIFVPLYIRLMGGESYGLVVAYATLIASLQVLDAGWSNLLSRQLALRAGRGGNQTGASSANLSRTVEVISWATGIVVGTSIVVLAPSIADAWLITQSLHRGETIEALRLIGAVVAIQWPSMAYQGALMGLQQQVRLNVVRIVMSSLQAFGAACLLWKVSPTAQTYFVWILGVQTLNTFWMRRLMWGKLGLEDGVQPRFDWSEITGSWRFASGVAGIALLASILTQADKIVLSKTVPLAAFAIYGVAFTVCGVLNVIAGPVLQAVMPHLTQLSVHADDKGLRDTYLRSSQWVALLVVPAWMVLSFHSRALMSLWMGAGAEADAAAGLLPLLALGSLLNAAVTLPYGLQISVGWTSLSVVKNIVAVAVSFPALLWAVGKYGTSGAAGVWVAINAGYMLLEVPIMHRRVLKGAMLPWYLYAFLAPLAVGMGAGWLSSYLAPSPTGSKIAKLAFLGVSFCLTTIAAAAVLPSVRHDLYKKLSHTVLARG